MINQWRSTYPSREPVQTNRAISVPGGEYPLLARPTGTLVIADEIGCDAELAATDLLGQASTARIAPPILLTPSESLARETLAEIERLPEILPTRAVARQSWDAFCEIIADDDDETVRIADDIASGHVQVMTRDPDRFLNQMANYRAMFLGQRTNVATAKG